MFFTTNVNENDSYIHKLGKLVPVYVVIWLTTIEAFLRGFTDKPFQALGALLAIVVALALVYFIEIRTQQVTKKDQILVAFGSTVMYIGIALIHLYLTTDIQVDGLIAIVVLGWTSLTPYLVK